MTEVVLGGMTTWVDRGMDGQFCWGAEGQGGVSTPIMVTLSGVTRVVDIVPPVAIARSPTYSKTEVC
jgi:hypothetical protein